MASPMSFFRRYQSTLMVVFGVSLMVVFLVGMVMPDPSAIFRKNEQSSVNEVIVKFKGGQMTRQDIDYARFRHFSLLRFLQALNNHASEKSGQQVLSSAMPLMTIPDPNESGMAQSDDAVLGQKLLTIKAAEEGLVVSDDLVDDYLLQVAGNKVVSNAELSELARSATDRRMDIRQIRDQLKRELTAIQMQILINSGLRFKVNQDGNGNPQMLANPTEARQLFSQTTSMVSAEVLPLKVADYLAKVTNDPKNAEISEIFEKGKYDYADPTHEKPGFKVSRKARLQYFVADSNAFLQNEMNKLTDKEVQEEYDRLVAAKDMSVMELIPEEKKETPEKSDETDLAPTIDDANGETPTIESPNTDENSDPAPTLESSDPPMTEMPATESPEASATESPKALDSEANKETETPKNEDGEPATGDGDSTPSAEAGGGQSSVRAIARSQFVSTQEPATQEPATQEPATQEPATQEPATQEPATQEPATQEPATQEPATQEPATQEPATQEPATQEPATQEPAMEQIPETTSVTGQQDEPVFRAKPLVDVAEDIKRRMKMMDARDAVRKAMEAADEEVRSYQSEYFDWKGQKSEGDENVEAEFPLYKGEEFAKKHNLTFVETDLLSRQELLLNKELTEAQAFLNNNLFKISDVVDSMYDQQSEYDPMAIPDILHAKEYKIWFAEKQKQKVPTLAEAKEDVKKYWKRQKAFEAAMVDAKKIAEDSNAAKSSLAKMFKERVTETGQFAWFSSREDFGLSKPAGVEDPGDKFMETAFGLGIGKAGVAPNFSNDIVYVIRIIERDTRTDAELNTAFIEAVSKVQQLPLEVQQANAGYVDELMQAWREEFFKEMQVKRIGE